MAKPLNVKDYKTIAKANDLTVAHLKAVVEVESLGYGFDNKQRPIILFEGHKFHKFTEGEYTGKEGTEDISYKRWTKKWYTGSQDGEYDRLERACKLDLEAALMSTSWGLFQIMGFNYKVAGYKNVKRFVDAMNADEYEQLRAFMGFIKGTKRKGKPLIDYLREKDWENFSAGYNGPSYKENSYHTRLKKAYEKNLS